MPRKQSLSQSIWQTTRKIRAAKAKARQTRGIQSNEAGYGKKKFKKPRSPKMEKD